MNPEEERSRRLDGGARRDCGVDDSRCRALGIAELAGALRGHAVVVEIEAAAESEAAIEHPRADYRQGRVAAGAQQFGQGRDRRRERPLAVVAQPVLDRIEPGEERRVRRQGQRDRRQGVGEAQPARRQRIEPWRRRRSAIAARQVGAQRVDGDEQNIRRARRLRPRCRPGRGGEPAKQAEPGAPQAAPELVSGRQAKKAITRHRAVAPGTPRIDRCRGAIATPARLAADEVSVRERPGAGREHCRAAPASRGSTPGCRRSWPVQPRPRGQVRLRARARASCPPGCRAASCKPWRAMISASRS